MLKHLKWPWTLTIITLFAGLVAYFPISPDVELPIHWNINGEVDGTAQPHIALFLIPIIQIILLSFFSVIKYIEPRRKNIENSMPAIRAILTGVVAILLLVQAIIISEAFEVHIFGPKLVFISLGILLVIMGNYMTKVRSGFFIGIRTPWTLSSDFVWKKTHRIGGKLLMVEGLIISIAPFLFNAEQLLIIFIATMIPATLIPVIYSWVIWRYENNESKNESSSPH